MDRFFDGCKLRPLWLVDAEDVAELAEFEAVLTHVDGLHGSAQNLDATLVQFHREVVGRLPPDGNDDAAWVFELHDVQHRLVAEFLEVQSIGLIVIGRDSLGIAIDHDGLVPQRAKRLNARHGAPVEFDATSDAVRSAPQHDNALARQPRLLGGHVQRDLPCQAVQLTGLGINPRPRLRQGERRGRPEPVVFRAPRSGRGAWIERHVVLVTMVREVQVIGFRRELGSQGVDLLYHRPDAHLSPQVPHVLLAHVAGLIPLCARSRLRRGHRGRDWDGDGLPLQVACDLLVGEAALFCLPQHFGPAAEAGHFQRAQQAFELVDIVELRKEPAIDRGERMDLLHIQTQFECLRHRPDTHRRWLLQLLADTGSI
mmetsp:Transcript_6965/g.17395  ORF Transcript_6965/g.17395 Transcript_6965/m.17395 type:complete len:370 (+) Transcript_6965:544-1653(+)